MTDSELIQGIVEAVRQMKVIPAEDELWDIEIIATYFRRSQGVVRSSIISQPSFPKAIRLPSQVRTGHPLYKAQEVRDWAESLKERH